MIEWPYVVGIATAMIASFIYHRRNPVGDFQINELRTLIGQNSAFTPGQVLGHGREGVIFELDSNRAIKIIFSRTEKDPVQERLEHEQKLRVMVEFRLDEPPLVVRIHELGEIFSAGSAYPFQVCEKIEGRTLRDELKKGALRNAPLRERITRLIDLISALDRLAAHNLHFVHIDNCNLMVDTQGRWRLIDFDALELGEIDFSTRKRFMRRLARVILDVLGNEWRKADFGPETDSVRKTFSRLKTIEATPKGERPERGTAFKTLGDLRSALELAASSLRDSSSK